MEEERWVSIEGFSKYEVSNLGRVRRHRKKGDRILPQHKHHNCLSMFVNMVNDKGEWKTAPVSRLVLRHFVGSDGLYVRYKDYDHSNCQLSNLSWSNDPSDSGMTMVSRFKDIEIYLRYHKGESMKSLAEEFDIGLSGVNGIILKQRACFEGKEGTKLHVKQSGVDHQSSIFTNEDVRRIRSLYFDHGYSVTDISTLMNVNAPTVSHLLGGITYDITPDTPIRFLKSPNAHIPLTKLVSEDTVIKIRNAYRRGARISSIIHWVDIGNYSVLQRALFTDEVPFSNGDSVRKLIEEHNSQLTHNRVPFTKEELMLLREDIASNKYSLRELMKKWNVIEYGSRTF